jgi:hypothetical protein
MTSAARAQDASLVSPSSCGPEWDEALERALTVELATWRRTADEARCATVRVEASPVRCDGEAPVDLALYVGDRAPLALHHEGGTVRALALSAAEAIERAYAACVRELATVEAVPAPWRDPRPMATPADHQLYFGEMEFQRSLRRPPNGTILARLRTGAFYDVERGGIGLVGDGSVAAWLPEGFWLRAELGPMGVAVGDGATGIGQLGGSLLVGFDAEIVAFGIGGGLGTANGIPGGEPMGRVDAYARIGLEPLAFASVLVSVAVSDTRVDLGLVSARFAVPLDRRLVVAWGGEVSFTFGSGRLDAGLQTWLSGDVGSSSGVALEAGITVAGLAYVPRCALGPCENEHTVAVGPGAHVGLIIRAGP